MTPPTDPGARDYEPTGSTSNPDPEQIRNDIERTRAELSRDVDTLGERVRPSTMARRQRDKMMGGVRNLRERVMGSASSTTSSATDSVRGTADSVRGTASSVAGSAQDAASRVGDAVTSAPQAVREQTQGNPLAAGLIAFGAGLVAASVLPATQKETQAAEKMKESAAPLVDDLKQAGKSMAEDMREPVRENVQGLGESAKGAAQDVGQQGKQAADDVRSSREGSGGA
jgi:hypothetical protein